MSAHLDEIDHHSKSSHDNDDDVTNVQHSIPAATGDIQHYKNGDPNENNSTQQFPLKNVKKEWVKFEEDDDISDDHVNGKINDSSNGGVKRKIKFDTAITNPLSLTTIAPTIDIPLDNVEQVNIFVYNYFLSIKLCKQFYI